MKIEMKDGKMIATAETIEEVQKLLTLLTPAQGEDKAKRAPYTRTCDQCGKKCKGRAGLSQHRVQAHEGKTWARGRKNLSTVV